MVDDPLIGAQLGSYRLEAVVGRGGMSAVYRGRHVRTNRTVAIKVLSPALTVDEEYRARFLEEARRASRVDEPHIIDVYDADEEHGRLYLAMRFVEGGDLSALLKREGRLTPARALQLIGQVADALDAAHAVGLVHRDVKPPNILIGPGEHVYLSDFGIAKATAGRALTQTGMFVGSPDYAAPEQWEGRRDIDGRADQYALAGVLHECLTGVRPFDSDSMTGLMYAHLHRAPPSVADVRPDVPPALDGVLARAMAKGRDERYGTCREFVAAARGAAGQLAGDATLLAGGATVLAGSDATVPGAPPPAQVRPTPSSAPTPETAPPPPDAHPPPAPPPPSRRRRYLAAGVAALVLAAGAIAGIVLATRGGDEAASGDTGTQPATTATTAPTTTAPTTTTEPGAGFSDPPSLFRPIDRDDASAVFRGDAYVFRLEEANRPLVSFASGAAPQDVRVAIDVRGAGGDYGAAVLCRGSGPGNYYLLAVASGQRYNVVKYRGGSPRSLVGGFQTSSVIEPGSAANRLEAECEGTGTVSLTLLVNGTRVASVADADNPLSGGKVGLRAGTDSPPVRVRFQNFVMTSLGG